MSERPLKKGDRVHARQLGMADVTGTITWIGPNRYGVGLRCGVKDEHGKVHWVDEDNVELEGGDGEPPAGGIQKGSRVKVVGGPHKGVEGDVYLASPKGRIGVRDDNEETYWVERSDLELAD